MKYSMIIQKLVGIYKKLRLNKAVRELAYVCNICGVTCFTPLQNISREVPDCKGCGSTLRMRSMIGLLSEALFGQQLSIPNFPTRPDIRGIGMSDWDGYAVPLAQKLNYTNTFYHQEPKFDVTHVPKKMENSLDFVISSDVFEHVLFPIQRAFDNIHRVLRPNGAFIFSVPYTLEPHTVEHFPELHDFRILQTNGQYLLENTTPNGEVQRFSDLIFHGGPGATLEMRVFCKQALVSHLEKAGFTDISFRGGPCLVHGIHWGVQWSLPVIARAGAASKINGSNIL